MGVERRSPAGEALDCNLGALIEAGVHYYRATDKTPLLVAGGQNRQLHERSASPTGIKITRPIFLRFGPVHRLVDNAAHLQAEDSSDPKL